MARMLPARGCAACSEIAGCLCNAHTTCIVIRSLPWRRRELGILKGVSHPPCGAPAVNENSTPPSFIGKGAGGLGIPKGGRHESYHSRFCKRESSRRVCVFERSGWRHALDRQARGGTNDASSCDGGRKVERHRKR